MSQRERKRALINATGDEYAPLRVIKRRLPILRDFINSKDEIARHIAVLNSYIYFYINYETRLDIHKGDVFIANFEYECGNELSGRHLVVALLDSSPINPLVTVIPLKSDKGRPLNPASDIYIGDINGINNGKKTIAIINQIRTIDKRRLFDYQICNNLDRIAKENKISSPYSEFTSARKLIFRLNVYQYRLLHQAVKEYVDNGFISHDK